MNSPLTTTPGAKVFKAWMPADAEGRTYWPVWAESVKGTFSGRVQWPGITTWTSVPRLQLRLTHPLVDEDDEYSGPSWELEWDRLLEQCMPAEGEED